MAEIHVGNTVEAGQLAAPGGFSTIINWTGAAMSVALVGGLAVWGYQLAVRDVSGVPVVRALEGPMRIAPEDPGGLRAAHQGLAVNSVAAEGSAEAPADRLILAPAPLDLAAEDLPRPQLDEVAESTAAETPATASAPEEAVLDGTVLALADALAEDVTPLSATIAPAQASIIPASVSGVVRSMIPKPRPAGDLTATAVANAVALAAASPDVEIDATSIAVGTRLVQFGAYDSPDAARADWVALRGQFSDFMHDKQRVVQEAVSGGKTFWRLRAKGFADINDARRFCSALLAEKQACIPVVVR